MASILNGSHALDFFMCGCLKEEICEIPPKHYSTFDSTLLMVVPANAFRKMQREIKTKVLILIVAGREQIENRQ